MAPSGKPAPERAGDKDKALEAALVQIERQFGKGSVMRLGEQTRVPVEVIPTGSIALDVALGLGGLPRGRIVEIYGPESSGKTTVALHALANAQKAGGIAAFIDAEHALDPEYAQKLGVDTDALLVSQPDTGEQALEIMDMLIRSGAIDVVVIDSVAALVPKAEIEGEMGDSHVGLQARLMSQALRKITGALSQTKTTAIFINQLREKVGVMFGSPETTTGGKALKFYASVRLDIRRIETLKDGTEAVGNRTRVKVVKNKMAPPFKTAEFDILYGIGITREGSLIDLGVEQGIVRKAGAWYTYEGDQLGQGKENARNYLRDNQDLANEIEKKIKEKLGVGPRLDTDATVPAPVRRPAPAGAARAGRESRPLARRAARRAKRGRPGRRADDEEPGRTVSRQIRRRERGRSACAARRSRPGPGRSSPARCASGAFPTRRRTRSRPVRGRRPDRRRRLRPGLGGITALQPGAGGTGAERRAQAARGGRRRDPGGHRRAARPGCRGRRRAAARRAEARGNPGSAARAADPAAGRDARPEGVSAGSRLPCDP